MPYVLCPTTALEQEGVPCPSEREGKWLGGPRGFANFSDLLPDDSEIHGGCAVSRRALILIRLLVFSLGHGAPPFRVAREAANRQFCPRGP